MISVREVAETGTAPQVWPARWPAIDTDKPGVGAFRFWFVGEHWESFTTRVDEGEDPGEVLDDLGVNRHCCRRMLVSHTDLVDVVAPYQ